MTASYTPYCGVTNWWL